GVLMVAIIRCLRGATFPVAGILLVSLAAGFAGCSGPSHAKSASTEQAAPPKIALDKIVYLSTHWYPEPQRQPDQIENPLLRELARQAVLIVARDDFGLVTRDETLGESFPDTNNEESANPDPGDAKKLPAATPLEIAIDVRSTGT